MTTPSAAELAKIKGRVEVSRAKCLAGGLYIAGVAINVAPISYDIFPLKFRHPLYLMLTSTGVLVLMAIPPAEYDMDEDAAAMPGKYMIFKAQAFRNALFSPIGNIGNMRQWGDALGFTIEFYLAYDIQTRRGERPAG